MDAGPTFGDVHDNLAAFSLALYEIEHGDQERGKQTLGHLRDYIRTTRDIQSVVWVLPRVEAASEHVTVAGFAWHATTPRSGVSATLSKRRCLLPSHTETAASGRA